MQQGCLFFCYSLPTLTTNWVQIFTGLLIFAYVWITKWEYWSLTITSGVQCLSGICRWWFWIVREWTKPKGSPSTAKEVGFLSLVHTACECKCMNLKKCFHKFAMTVELCSTPAKQSLRKQPCDVKVSFRIRIPRKLFDCPTSFVQGMLIFFGGKECLEGN